MNMHLKPLDYQRAAHEYVQSHRKLGYDSIELLGRTFLPHEVIMMADQYSLQKDVGKENNSSVSRNSYPSEITNGLRANSASQSNDETMIVLLKDILKNYLSSENIILDFGLYCENCGISSSSVRKNMSKYRIKIAELLKQFRQFEKEDHSSQMVLNFMPIFEQLVAYKNMKEASGETADLSDYYELVPAISFPVIRKVATRYFGKQNYHILNFYASDISMTSAPLEAPTYLCIEGVEFDQDQILTEVQKLAELGYPLCQGLFLDHMRRVAKEKAKEKHI